MDFSKLHGKAKKFVIGKDLPEDERMEVEIFPLSIEDLHLVDFSDIVGAEEQLVKIKRLLSKMLRVPEEEISKWDVGYFEDLTNAAMQRLNVTDEKQARIKKMMEERKLREVSGG